MAPARRTDELLVHRARSSLRPPGTLPCCVLTSKRPGGGAGGDTTSLLGRAPSFHAAVCRQRPPASPPDARSRGRPRRAGAYLPCIADSLGGYGLTSSSWPPACRTPGNWIGSLPPERAALAAPDAVVGRLPTMDTLFPRNSPSTTSCRNHLPAAPGAAGLPSAVAVVSKWLPVPAGVEPARRVYLHS